ncbi:MAG: response regulator [Gemmatimonadales bacterium]|nr:MAG: response regulator [Gemmatimonadales bacterium]
MKDDATEPDAPPNAAPPPEGTAGRPYGDRGAPLVELRNRAERQVELESDVILEKSPIHLEDVRTMFRELRVHQIQLEMQNEELLRAKQEIEDSRARYLDLYDLAPVAYLTLDRSGKIIEANLTAARLLLEDRETLVDRSFASFVAPGDRETWIGERGEIFEGSGRRTFELELVRADGAALPVRGHAVLAGDDEGGPLARVVVSDISEQKRAERERAHLEERLRQVAKADSLGRMAGALAHRFNNLLAVTTGNLQMAMEDLPDASETRDAVSDALAAARDAAEVSGMLLTYLGQSRDERAPHDLSELCRRLLPMLRAGLPRNVELEERFPDRGPNVLVSPAQIQRVLTHLVNNASEAFDGSGGLIRIHVDTVSPEDIPVRSRFPASWTPDEGPHARIAVEDEGPGIPDDVVEQIFDPFFSTKAFGRGLGLSVALGAVRAQEGAIAARRSPKGGSLMEVYLPTRGVVTAETQWTPEGGSATDRREGRGTVLIVEDEPLLRKVGIKMLTRLGYETISAADGVEAVEVFRNNRDRISWVLCDLVMPRMNGWDTLAMLRSLDPDLPVVLTSGFDEAHAMGIEARENPHAFLPKPWTLERLAGVAPTA